MILAGILGEVGAWTLVILGVGMLIFIHEMGHFLVAKWAGVKVLAFSLGFGPEMVGWTRGPTRYRVGWVPLGGYVKMSGEVELPEGGYAPDDYPSQPVSKRALIIAAGVIMNALLGFVLFAGALAFGLPAVVLGTVEQGRPGWASGLRPGDRVVEVDGERVLDFGDLVYATMEGKPLRLGIEREGRRLEIPLQPDRARRDGPFGIGVSPDLGSVLEVAPGSPAAKAGFRTGDRIVAVEGVPVDLDGAFEFRFATTVAPLRGPLRVTVEGSDGRRELRLEPPPPSPKSGPRIGIGPLYEDVDVVLPGSLAAEAGWKDGDRPVSVGGKPLPGSTSIWKAVWRAPPGDGVAVRVARGPAFADLPLPADPGARLEILRGLRFRRSDSPTAVEVDEEGPPGPDGAPRPSPAAAAGIPSGASITAVGGAEVATFEQIVARFQAAKEGEPIAIAWKRGKEQGTATVTPVRYPGYGLEGLALATVPPPNEVFPGVLEIPGLALRRCVVTTRQILATVGGLFGGSVDRSNLGGPILIAQVTKQATRKGPGHYFWILATLSINLMFLNVLPVPLLDGGQLALLALEAVQRKRPSEAVVGISQMVGLALLLGLMVMVTFNDVVRLVKG